MEGEHGINGRKIKMNSMESLDISGHLTLNVKVLHLYSAICIATEALFVNHLYSTPSRGRLRQCRLGFEQDSLRLLPLPPNAGT